MGTKLDLHHLSAVTPPSRVVPHRVSPRDIRQRRTHLALAAFALFVLFFVSLLRPVRVVVAGSPEVVPHGTNVARAATLLKLSGTPGNLVDVTGAVLREGAGAAPIYLRNGQSVPAKTRLHNGDTFACLPAHDVVEAMRESATIVKAPRRPGMAESAVVGVRRVQVGLVSGKTYVDTTSALATVPAPTGKSRPKVVALTFDDGPHPSQTPQMLAILRKHSAHATFFVLGDLTRFWPKQITAELADGNEVGLHTWNHENLAHMSAAAIDANMAKTQARLKVITGKTIWLMRPPYGALSATARTALRGAGYRIVLWDVDTNDWQRPGADVIYSRIMKGAHSGAIILCHDGGGPRAGTIAAVARAVPDLQARGYRLVTVSQVLGLQPVPQGGALIAGTQRWDVKSLDPELHLTLDDEPLSAPESPVEVNGQLLVPAKLLLDALNIKWQWDQQAQKLTVPGPLETLTLRLNSPKLEHQYGEAEQLPVPPVVYRGTLMVPLWVVLHCSGATALYDADTNRLSLMSLQKGLQSVKLGQGPPRNWGKDVKWREHLKAPANSQERGE